MAEVACKTKDKFVGDKPISKIKERKAASEVRVSFQKDGTHYIFGSGQRKNYKFKTIMQFSKWYRQDGQNLVEWFDINDNMRKFYSDASVFSSACRGEKGELVASNTLQVKASWTFIKIGSAVLLTYDKVKEC